MLIQRLRVEGLLSFDRLDLELGSLNVLVGANGSGKSNLIDVISLFRAAAGTGMGMRMRPAGGVSGWFHKRGTAALMQADFNAGPASALEPDAIAKLSPRERQIARMIAGGYPTNEIAVVLNLGVNTIRSYRKILMAKLGLSGAVASTKATYRADLRRSDEMFSILSEKFTPGTKVDRSGLSGEQSILAAKRLGAVAEYGRLIERISIYRYFLLDPRSGIRGGGDTGADPTVLSEYGENLAMVLHNLDVDLRFTEIDTQLSRVGEGFDAVKVRVVGNRAYLELVEGDLRVSAARISDGTLRFLCLMAILLHPSPPPLICIEEPELGLHPDAIRIVAEAIEDAAERTQLIITTHSPELVSCLQSRPEALLICEKKQGATRIERPNAKRLAAWMKDYSLGELWKSGEIGAVRW